MKAVTDTERHNEAAAAEGAVRDALFESLALQTGLVCPEVLAEARREQSLSPSHMLADLLVKRQVISEQARQGLELLVEEQRLRNGLPATRIAEKTGNEVAANDSSVRPGETLSLDSIRAEARPPPRKFAGYELLSEIARGGMGVVFKARQVKLDRHVALKMILSGELSGEEQIRRFYSEAEAAARLDHPNIVPVYEVGESNGQHYYSMALIEGQSLHELVKKEGPLPARQAAQFMIAVAQAVGYAHDKGIVHRDLKPQNILLEGGEQPKVTDFGLAKQVNGVSDLTLTGQILGTPSYMPPEQAAGQGASVGPLADVYALGATLYYTLAGHAPFHGSSPAETIRQVLETEPVPLRRVNPTVPRDLETICHKCLRKEPAARYDSAASVALDLRRWLAREPIVARPVGRLERSWLWCRRRPVLASALALGMLFLTAATLVVRDRLCTARAAGLVDAALTADTRDLESLRSQIAPYRYWAVPRLRREFAAAGENSKQQLHASICLAEDDPRQTGYLLERLGEATPDEAQVIGRTLLTYQESMSAQLWRAMENPRERTSRLRLASALAILTPQDARWTQWSGELSSQLVTLPSQESAFWMINLRPVGKTLADELERIYRNSKSKGEPERSLAANVLADYRKEETDRLVELAVLADAASEFAPLLDSLRPHAATAAASLRKVLREPVPADVSEQTRDVLWKPHEERDLVWRRQAAAAVALLNLGEGDAMRDLLRHSPDPTLRSYIVTRLHQLGTPHGLIAAQLQSEAGTDVQRSLILSLGAYSPLEIGEPDLEQISLELLALHEASPDAGVHSAADWTLRRWHKEEALRAATPAAVASTFTGQGNWLVNSHGETFVRVSPPATFTMLERTNQTVPTRVTLDYPFAIATREVTIRQFLQFKPDQPYDATYAPTLDCPIHKTFPSWQMAAAYCNWLSEREGWPRQEWAYDGAPATGLTLAKDFPSRKGYRLPTEAEWEFVCQAGTTTMFSCGDTVEALNGYGWHQDNSSARCWPVGSKMPSDLGTFDMHGNVMEWCHRQNADPHGQLTTAFGTAVNAGTLRSGSFYLGPIGIRSRWRRTLDPPQEFWICMGFRVARSLPEKQAQ